MAAASGADGRSSGTAVLSRLIVDIDAVVANWHLLAGRAGAAECAAVMKADGYGLGVRQLAPALAEAGCRSFFVAHPAEGVAMRRHLAEAGAGTARVFILHGLQEGEAALFRAHDLCPVLSTERQIRLWQAAAREAGRPLPAALHVDSGMNRLGLAEDAFRRLAADRDGFEGLSLQLLLTHLACGDDPADPMNAMQRARFLALRALLPQVPASLSNSAGIFHPEHPPLDLVRPGIALYGVDPVDRPPAQNPLHPVVEWHSRILQIREIDASEAVGYGAAFRAKRRTRLATVSVGYADGYLRGLSNKAYGALHGVRVPLAGRVSMDLLTFDITDLPADRVREGDELELAGHTVSVGELARWGGTIGYEILTRLGPRINRRYKKAGQLIDNEDACGNAPV
ncbi:alanine racemase [Marinibaculum pumilum]|uniref:Alanine racemase n=1 Tax=Marinibaculum pumilum TaxID=1766165 RepID=A0ABV7KTG5_9PROT